MKNQRENWMTFDGEDLAARMSEYRTLKYSVASNPIYNMVIRNEYAYYSTVLDAQSWMTSLNFVGDQGELVKMTVPQARALIRQLLTLLTKQKLAFNAIAKVQSHSVQEAMRIANALAVDLTDKQDLDIKAQRLVERALISGTSFMKTTWRSDFGKPRVVQKDENGVDRVLYDGDVEITVPHFFDLTYNYTVEDWSNQDWVECRVKRNRWSLISQHPDLEEEILKLPSVDHDERTRTFQSVDNDDMIHVYELYHRPTPSLPRGRLLIYGDTKSIFHDDVNRYGCIPIEQYKPEPIDGIGFGYAMLSNLLPAQEMYDHSWSCLATNQSALGVQNVLNPRGSDINVQQLYGMNFIDYTPQPVPGGGKPEKLDLLNSASELFKLPESLLENMQQMSFINAAVRGELPASTSGVAIATLTTNALEFLSAYSTNLQQVLKDTIMHGINAYRKFSKTERVVRLVGKNLQSSAKKFMGEDLDSIEAIEMQSVNPLMQTIAGRIDIAEKALDKGLITDMQSYVSILDGVPLSQQFEVDLSQNDLIQQENEMLMEGDEQVVALSTDKHPQHIMKHNTLLNDAKARTDPQLVQRVQDHMLEHLKLQTQTDPLLMAMANTGKIPEGIPPPGPPPPGPPPQPGQGLEMPVAEVAEPAEDLLGRV